MRSLDAVLPPRLGRDFRWLVVSTWVSNLGDGIALAAGPLLVASLTRDPLLVGAATFLQFLPPVLIGLYAGAVVDRHDRRAVSIVVNVLRAATLGVLLAAMATGTLSIAVVLAVMFVLGVTETFGDGAFSALAPQLVDSRDLGVASARQMGGFVIGNRLAGPPIGAFLFAAGIAWPFLAQAAGALLAAVLISRVAFRRGAVERVRGRGATWWEVREGLVWLRDHAAMRTLTVVIFAFNVTFGVTFAILVLYALEVLDMGPVGFGLLTTASAVGGLVAMVLFDRLEARVPLAALMRIGLTIETLFHLVYAVNRIPAIALAMMVIFGMHEFVWGAILNAVRLRAVPERLQGRVGSAYRLAGTAGLAAGAGLGSLLASVAGVLAPFWFAFAGSALLLVVLWRPLLLVAREDEALHGTEPGPAST